MAERPTAWITGGGRGIGRACAVALAREGVSIGLTARSQDELREAVKACEAVGGSAVAAPADVTKPAKLRAAYASVARAFEPPRILVNAAGVARSEAFLKTTPDFMAMHWELNVMGTFHAMQAALPSMVANGYGRIINVASIAGKVGHAYVAAYTASKHAVVGLTRAVAAEVADKGVTVNAVCPGYVNTKMTDENVAFMVQKTKRPAAEVRERIKSFSPQHRMIEPDEVAGVVAFLARPESRGIHGQAITIDGGGVQW